MPIWLQVLLNGLVLAALIVPTVRAYFAGFVKTTLQFLRYVIALIVSFIFVSPLGALIKNVWLGKWFYKVILKSLEKTVNISEGTDALIAAIPSGIRKILEVFKVDLVAIQGEIETTGEEMIQSFAHTVSDRVAGIVSIILAFVLLFVVSLLLLLLATKLLNYLFQKLKALEKVNRIFGLLVGLLIGFVCASLVAQVLVVILTTFTGFDYSSAPLLWFFHDISPLRWILHLIIRSMA